MTTESIIVYRNPLEKAFWESELLFPLGVSFCAFVLCFVFLDYVLSNFIDYRHRNTDVYGLCLGVISFVVAILTFNHFNI